MSETNQARPPSLAAVWKAELSAWRREESSARLWLLAPFAFLVGALALYVLDKDLLRTLSDEDGVFEWGQVVCFVLGGIFAARAALKLRRRSLLEGLAWAGLCLGLFFIAGEELAWGQRLIAFETPAELEQINDKGEASLHNISSVARFFEMTKAAAGLYGTLGALAIFLLRRRRGSLALELVLPPLFLAAPFAILLAMWLGRQIFFPDTVPVGYAEVDELELAFGLAAFAYHVDRRLRLAKAKA